MLLTVLMIEVEQPEGVSARKLVLETAKHNVLTVYEATEGVEMMRRFPNVDAVIVHTGLYGTSFSAVIQGVKQIRNDVPIIALSPEGSLKIESADYVVPSHEPQKLLELLATKFGAGEDN